jgi:mannose-6-phosphate isomerase
MTLYPLLLEPILKERVWGGRRLARLGRSLPPRLRIGESWEVADLPEAIEDGRSMIRNGPLAGRTLHEVLAGHGDDLMGAARLAPQGLFPLLVKYLDARANLSVQVHPTEEYARQHPGALPKSEAWYVVQARPGAIIY